MSFQFNKPADFKIGDKGRFTYRGTGPKWIYSGDATVLKINKNTLKLEIYYGGDFYKYNVAACEFTKFNDVKDIDPEALYESHYDIDNEGNKILKQTFLLGKDLTHNQIKTAKLSRGVKPGTKRSPYATKNTETVTINFRVPKIAKEAAKDFVRPLLKEFINTLNI